MATDPNQLLQTLLGTVGQQGGILQNAQNNALAQQGAEQQLALGQQQQTLNDQQIAAQQQEATQQQRYQADVSNWIAGGSHADGLSGLIAKYPKQWQALQQGWKVKSADQQQADLRTFGTVYNALDNGSPQVAIAELKQRRAAEVKAGIDTTELDQHLQQLESGDPATINAGKGWARAQVAAASAAMGDSNIAKTVGVDVDPGDNIKVAGGHIYDAKLHQYVPDPEGGDPASGDAGGDGSASGGRRTMGWTPSTTDGGDNAPAVVSAKIAALGKAIGVDPNKPLTLEQAKSLSKAIAPTEGGPGSVADRNNNPTNIKDGAFARSQPGYAGKGDGGYAKFTDKAAGDAAAQQLLAHYYARGQRTITDIIAGKPSGGTMAAPAPDPAANQAKFVKAYGKAPTGFRWVQGGTLEPIPGGPKDDKGGSGYDTDTLNTMADQYLAGDTTVLQNLGRGPQAAEAIRQIRTAIVARGRAQGLNGAQIAGRIADFKGVLATERAVGTRTAQVELPAVEAQKLIPLALKASDAVPRSGFLPFSKAEQAINHGVNNPQLRQFVAANNALVNVYSRAVSPSGVPTDSDKAHARQLLDTAYDNASYHAVVNQMQKEIAAARTAPQQVRNDLQQSVGSTGRTPSRFSHMSVSGKFGWDGKQWVAVH